MAGPDMVDGDAGGQWMVRPDEPAREGEPAAGALRGVRRHLPRCPGRGERFSAHLTRRDQCLPGVGERLRGVCFGFTTQRALGHGDGGGDDLAERGFAFLDALGGDRLARGFVSCRCFLLARLFESFCGKDSSQCMKLRDRERGLLLRRPARRERGGFEVAADELAPLRFDRSRRKIDRRDVQPPAQTGRNSRSDRMAFVWIPLVATREEKRRNRGISIERASQPVERGIDLAGNMIEPDLVRFEDRAQGVVIGLWKRIGFVVVALRTTDREPEERKARMFDGVFEPLFPGKHLVVAGQKPGGAHRGAIFRGPSSAASMSITIRS